MYVSIFNKIYFYNKLLKMSKKIFCRVTFFKRISHTHTIEEYKNFLPAVYSLDKI